MQVEELLSGARDAITVGRVYGEPFERNGVAVIPAAKVGGGGGGGGGEGEEPEGKRGSGSGAGFGLVAKPAGVFVVSGDDVRWVPAVDVTRIAILANIVLLAGVLSWRSIATARIRAEGGRRRRGRRRR